ncbi:MAG TPA: sigma-70 family RNA polymerase sigma factor [Gaiellaceae bacterium]|nr:sigma-70 family RNA polymerase sigma factor [Gaiellaceae bacterium]
MAATESSHLASRAVDDLYRAHVAEVYRYAYAVLGNHADAEDVTQTTFLNAYRALEQGVRPRKPANWLLTITSNAIKQRFRQEQSRPRQVELDETLVHSSHAADDDDEGPTVGELLTALAKIPPQQRQAIVLREFEGRSYGEIAEILGVTTSALETLLFRARRSLAEELQHQLTCTEAQLAISRSVDDRLGRKEKRRLRDHLAECPDCARFARLQQRHRSALRGLALLPIPVSLAVFKGLEGSATAAVVPIGAAAGAGTTAAVGVGVGVGAAGAGAGAAGTSGGILASGLGLKVAAAVAAAGVAGGVGVVGSNELGSSGTSKTPTAEKPGERLGQTAPRGVSVPGNGVARGKPTAPGQTKITGKAAAERRAAALARAKAQKAKAAARRAAARGQAVSQAKRAAAAERKAAVQTKRTSKTSTTPKESATGENSKTPQGSQQVPTEKTKPAATAGPSSSASTPSTPDAPAKGNGNGGGPPAR